MIFRPSFALLASCAICLLSPAASRAADAPNAAEAKLREQLRSTMLQMRTLQGERDTLGAMKTQLETEKTTLVGQVEAMGKQLAVDKDASDKALAELREKSAAQATEMAGLRESLEKWKVSQKQAATLAQKKEADRAKLAQEKIELERVVTDQRTKNLAMFKIGNEVLSRYEKFGLGTAISAREPFIGTTRVKLENLVQDLGDKLAEQRIKPEVKAASAPAAPAATAPKSAAAAR